MPIYVGRRTTKFMGHSDVPQDILRRRRSVHDIMRRMGTPVIIKHRYNDLDVKSGAAVPVSEIAPDTASDIYNQVRNFDPLSYGTGFVGAKDGNVIYASDEWFDPSWDGFQPNTDLPDSTFIWRSGVDGSAPPAGLIPAPKYRGYGPGVLTYIIMPDRAEDYYKANVGGPLFKVQEAYAICPWYPDVNDNDLIIPVELSVGQQIRDMDGYGKLPRNQRYDRFEAKMASPISMRGYDNRGRKEGRYSDTWGNRYVVNQTFEMDLLPTTDVAYEVEVDR